VVCHINQDFARVFCPVGYGIREILLCGFPVHVIERAVRVTVEVIFGAEEINAVTGVALPDKREIGFGDAEPCVIPEIVVGGCSSGYDDGFFLWYV